MHVAPATVQAKSMTADAQTSLQVTATATETNSMHSVSATEPVKQMSTTMAFVTPTKPWDALTHQRRIITPWQTGKMEAAFSLHTAQKARVISTSMEMAA